MRWVSVKTRLPKAEHEDYLVWLAPDYFPEGCVGIAVFWDGEFRDTYGDWCGEPLHGVTHWMPLPKKPHE